MKSADEMPLASESRIYTVALNTRLGKRNGQLLLHFSGESVTGIFRIMQSDNLLQGRFGADGSCTLHGSIRTLGNIYPFEGSGYIRPESIEMRLSCMGDILPLRGSREHE